MSIRIPHFKGIEVLKGYIAEAEIREKQLSEPSEIPIEQRLRNLSVIKKKLEAYRDIMNSFEFLVLHQEVMLESLKVVGEESMANNGKLGFQTTRNLSKMHSTMNDQYNEYLKENDA